MRTFAVWIADGRVEKVEDVTEQSQVMRNSGKSEAEIKSILAEQTGATAVVDAEDIRLAISEAMREKGEENSFDWLLSEIYGTSEVASELGWTLSKVSVYRLREAMPKPIGEVGGRPVWWKKDIIEFKKKRENPDN